MPKHSGMTLSVTKEDRDKINELCELEGRSRKAQILWMVNKRLKELSKKGA